MESYKYFAFISYSHKDKAAAKKLYRRLNDFRLPATLKSEYARKEGREIPDRVSPIFIDDEEMADSSVIEGMKSGLSRSRFLIVVCSPNSAGSAYVNSEVEYFIKSGRGDSIIPYIIDGKPCSGDPKTECYPPAMRDKDRMGADFQELKGDAALRVIAIMLKVDMGVLLQREKQRRERRIISAAAVVVAIALAFGLYNNYMRSRIEEENLKYRTSLSNQLRQTGETIEQGGNVSEALMYYAKSLQTNPSNNDAKMNALIALQEQGWLIAVDADHGKESNVLADQESQDDLGVLIGNDKFGYQNYRVYLKERMITLVPENGGAKYQAEIPEEYQSTFIREYEPGEFDPVYSALAAKNGEVRLVLAADNIALVYSFEDQEEPQKQVHTGIPDYYMNLSVLEERYLKDETAYVYGLYGSDHDGLVLFSLGFVKETPVLIDVFEKKLIRTLDMGEDFKVTNAAFAKNGDGIAILAKVMPQSAMMNTRLRYYDKNGDLLHTTLEVDGGNQVINIDYSPDGKALVLCRKESVFLFSTEKDELLCPKLRMDRVFERADYTESGTVIVKCTDGTAIEYELRYFEPAMEYTVDPPEVQPEDIDNQPSFAINDDLFILNNDPDIDLLNRKGEVLDKAEGAMLLPEGMNDGILWWGLCTADRKASVAFNYGYMEEVFYRVRYDEAGRKITKVEPIVLQGRTTDDLVAFDDMCAVRTTDGHLLGYRNDSTEPFYDIDIGGMNTLECMKWLGNDIAAIEFSHQPDDMSDDTYSLELWNVRNGRRIAVLENDSVSEITDLRYSDGIFSYWKGDRSRYWVLEADDPDEKAIRFLSNLSVYKQDENDVPRFVTPVFSGDMGNWGEILK